MSPADVPDVGPDITPLDCAIREYFTRVDAGEAVSTAEFMTAYPDLRDELQAFFDDAAFVKRLAGTPRVLDDTSTQYQTVNEPVAAPTASQTTPQSESTSSADTRELKGPFPITLGQYRVLRAIGKGAMGIVYVADDLRLGRKVALKVPLSSVVIKPEHLDRFLREAQASAKLRHHNICPVYEVNELDGIHYIAMAFIEGKPLSDVMSRQRRFTGKQIAVTIRKIALALEVAHRAGIVHRDLKPANIMIERDGEPIVMDFGLARQINSPDEVQLTQEGMILGTPAYMSPEQVRSELNKIGPTSDIYSLGVMLYELLCGRHPFSGALMSVLMDVANEHKAAPRPSEVQPTCDPQLEAICLRMVSKQIEGRYQSMQEVAAALTGYLKAGQTAPDVARAPAPVTTIPPVPTTPTEKTEPTAAASLADAEAIIPLDDQPRAVSQPLTQSAGNGRRAPRRRWLALGGLGALVLAGVIIITITNRDGSQSELTIPDTSQVKITHKATPAAPRAAAKKDVAKVPAKQAAETGWYGWPVDAPKPAVAPFNAEQAKQHQENWAKYLNVPVEYTNSIGMKFRLIPPGEFMMGCSPEVIEKSLEDTPESANHHHYQIESEDPQHPVILTQPIYLGVHEVRQQDYQAAIGVNPSHFSGSGNGKELFAGLKTSSFPVENVTAADAANFFRTLSQKEKLKSLSEGKDKGTAESHGLAYRFPTEAQWEFACRAGATTQFWCGDQDQQIMQAGWNDSNSTFRTHAVGELKENPFGLYDVRGNVWELVEDAWDSSYYEQFRDALAVDPVCCESNGTHVMRGGACDVKLNLYRVLNRQRFHAAGKGISIGFRAALSVDAVRQVLRLNGPVIPQSSPRSIRSNSPVSRTFAAQRSAAEHVLKLGGTVVLESAWGKPLTLVEGALPNRDFRIREIRVRNSEFSDNDLEPLHACTQLDVLHLNQTKITDKGLAAALASWPRLSVLGLADSSLASLDLDLPMCPALRELHCPSGITDQGLRHVAKSFPLLKSVCVSGTSGLKVQALGPLRYLSDLTCGGDLLTAENVKVLSAIPSLQRLTCTGPVNDEVASRIGAFGTQLQTLEITVSENAQKVLSDAGFDALGKSLQLLEFTVRGAKGAPSLAGLMSLASMRDLKSISILTDDAEAGLSASDISQFQQRHPAVTVTVGSQVYLGLISWPESPDGGIAPWKLPKDAPEPAIAPFSPEDAQRHQTEWASYLHQDVEVENSVGMKLRLIPPGEFVYPHPPRTLPHVGNVDLTKRSLVRISAPFCLGVSEVTIDNFAKFVDETGYITESESGMGGVSSSVLKTDFSTFDRGLSWKRPGPWKSLPSDPVTQVNWKDASAYCKWLTKKEGVTYRLPTETEWFHSLRAGSAFTLDRDQHAQESLNAGHFFESIPTPLTESTSPVRATGPVQGNPYGLVNMIGNVWELVYAGHREHQAFGNSLFPMESTDNTLGLGAGWETTRVVIKDLWCNVHAADRWYPTLGFRILREITAENSDEVERVPKGRLLSRGTSWSTPTTVSRAPMIAGVRSWAVESKQHTAPINVMAFDPALNHIATGDLDGCVRVWTKNGVLVQVLHGHAGAITSVHFAEQGKRLVTGDITGELRIWDVTIGELVWSHKGGEECPVALSNDGVIAGFVYNDKVALVDCATGTQEIRTAVPSCRSLAWSPDGKFLATTAEEKAVFVWQVRPWKQVAKIPLEFVDHYGFVLENSNLSWSPDGKMIALNHRHGKKLYLIDGQTFQPLPALERPDVGGGSAPSWSHDSRRLMAVSWVASSPVFEMPSGRLLFSLPKTAALCWSPDDTEIYSSSGDVFDARTGERVRQLDWSKGLASRTIALAPDGRFLSTSDRSGQTAVWDAAMGQLLSHWNFGPLQLRPVWSPDGNSIVAISKDQIQLVSPRSGAVFRILEPHIGGTAATAFSPDGRWLATTGTSDNYLRVFDTVSGQQKWQSDTRNSGVVCIAWSPDGARIATCHNQSGEIRIWSSNRGEQLKSYGPATHKDAHVFAASFKGMNYLDWSLESAEIFVGFYPYAGAKISLIADKFEQWGWHYRMHADSFSLAPNRESRLCHNPERFTGYITTPSTPLENLGCLGHYSYWMPDSRRVLIDPETSSPFGYDLVTRRRLGTIYPVSVPNVWLCIGPTGHYRSGFIDKPGDGTDPQALTAVEEFLVYVAMHEDGSQVTYTPQEFRDKFGWKNDPTKATLLDFPRQ